MIKVNLLPKYVPIHKKAEKNRSFFSFVAKKKNWIFFRLFVVHNTQYTGSNIERLFLANKYRFIIHRYNLRSFRPCLRHSIGLFGVNNLRIFLFSVYSTKCDAFLRLEYQNEQERERKHLGILYGSRYQLHNQWQRHGFRVCVFFLGGKKEIFSFYQCRGKENRLTMRNTVRGDNGNPIVDAFRLKLNEKPGYWPIVCPKCKLHETRTTSSRVENEIGSINTGPHQRSEKKVKWTTIGLEWTGCRNKRNFQNSKSKQFVESHVTCVTSFGMR